MFTKKNKKGSHVGMILSFTIFIIAVVFSYTIIGSPIKESTTKAESLEIYHKNLVDLLYKDVIIARTYDTVNVGGCIEFSTPENSYDSIDFIASTYNGTEIHASISGGNTLVQGGHGLVKIYYAEKGLSQTLNSPGAGCISVIPKSISYEKIITEESILEVIDRVQNDYINLTKDMSVSTDDEINILFERDAGTLGVATRTEMKVDIYARKYEINYLSSEGNYETGGIILNLW